MRERGGRMLIEVIGPGCPFCRKLYRRTVEVVAEKGIEAEVLHVTDLKTAVRFMPMTPVLRVDGEILHRGKLLPSKERIAELLDKRAPRRLCREGETVGSIDRTFGEAAVKRAAVVCYNLPRYPGGIAALDFKGGSSQ